MRAIKDESKNDAQRYRHTISKSLYSFTLLRSFPVVIHLVGGQDDDDAQEEIHPAKLLGDDGGVPAIGNGFENLQSFLEIVLEEIAISL